MREKSIIKADELAEILDVSEGHAYKIIQKLNSELSKKGYMTFAGRVPRKYVAERCYGLDEEMKVE